MNVLSIPSRMLSLRLQLLMLKAKFYCFRAWAKTEMHARIAFINLRHKAVRTVFFFSKIKKAGDLLNRNRAYYFPNDPDMSGVKPLNIFQQWLFQPTLTHIYQQMADEAELEPWEANYADPAVEAAFHSAMKRALA